MTQVWDHHQYLLRFEMRENVGLQNRSRFISPIDLECFQEPIELSQLGYEEFLKEFKNLPSDTARTGIFGNREFPHVG